MILKRLLSLSFSSRRAYSNIGTRYNFSSNEQKQAQNQPQPEVTQVQQNNNQQTIVKDTQKRAYNKQNTWKKKGRDRYQDRMGQSLIVDKYLYYKKPEINMEQILPQLQKLRSQQEIKQKLQEYQRRISEEQQIPLRKYQKQLKLNIDTLSDLAASRTFIEPNKRRYNRLNIQQQKKKLLNSFTREQFDTYCQSGQKIRLTQKDVKQICELLDEQPSKSYLINLLYYETQGNFNTISQRYVHLIKNNIISGVYHQANPLKFFWFSIKQHPKFKKQYSPLFVRQLNKLHVNSCSVHKQLKQLTYFYLNQGTSSKVVANLLEISKNLQELIQYWYLTMMLFSRIKSLNAQINQNASVQFSDIINFCREEKFQSFLRKTLPRILLQDDHLLILQKYQNGLQRKQKKQQKTQTKTVKEQENLQIQSSPFGNQLRPQTKITLQYKASKDDQPIVSQLRNHRQYQLKFKSLQYSIVQNIVKGKYDKVLKYYKDKFIKNDQSLQKINQYQKQALQQFDNSDHQALYIFKKLFQNPTFSTIDNYQLTHDIYSNIFKKSRNLDQNKKLFNKKRTKTPNNSDNVNENDSHQIIQEKQEISQERTIPQQQDKQKKPKKQRKGAFKKQNASFSTTKQTKIPQQQKVTKAQSQQHYEQYLKTVKQTLQEQNKKQLQKNRILQDQFLFKPLQIFDFRQCKSVEEVEAEFKKHLHQINEDNIGNIMRTYSQIPVVSNINNLLKYYFLSSKTNKDSSINPHSQLKVQFKSSIGQIQKNYGDYINGCLFMFPLPNQLYTQLLADQQKRINRQHFKRIVAHIALFKTKLTDKLVDKICNICEKQKIGITLLEIINLINTRKIKLQRNSINKIASSIQHFKNMESDLLKFVKDYCDRENIQIQTKLFQPYIANLTIMENYEQLNDFLHILMQQLKPKEYKINNKLTKQQNFKAEKQYKQKQALRSNRQLFQMIKITANSLKPRTKIPAFMPQILQMYLKKKTDQMKSQQYGISLIIYSQDDAKFLELLSKVKNDPKENTQYVFECLVKCLTLFGNRLKDKIDKILGSTLYIQRFDLNQNYLKQMGLIFKQIDIPSAYTQYLQYVLRKQPTITHQTRSLYYKIFNASTDDNAKNQMSGLLDYIFNPNREKQRVQYKLIKQQQQKKFKILEALNQKAKQELQAQQSVSQVELKEKKKGKKQNKAAQPLQGEKNLQTKAQPQVKQKKKSKKQQKKALKQQQKKQNQKKPVEKKAQKTQKQKKQQKGVQIVTSQYLKYKRQIKQLAKINNIFGMDKNDQIFFSAKLCTKDLRTPSVKQFSQNFMQKFSQKQEQQLPEKQLKTRAKKSKQGQKQSDKKQSSKKQSSKKQSSKKSRQKQATASKKN